MNRIAFAERTARWSALHPWRAVAAWLLLVVVAVGLGSAVSMQTPTAADQRVGQSGVAAAMIESAGLSAPDTEYVLITGRSDETDKAAATAVAHRIAGKVSHQRVVADVDDPTWSKDGRTLMLAIELESTSDGTNPDVSGVQEAVSAVATAHPDLRIRQTGTASLGAAVDDRVGSDLGSAEFTSLPITLAIMVVVFGALIAAGIPVLLALTSVVATMGLVGPISRLIPMESTVTSMILLIGMAVGVDYSLFYLKRERQERRRGADTLDAVGIAAKTSGHSIVVSGSAVIACMAGLYAVGNVTFNSLATGAILVVAIAVAGSLTVLPALLILCGRWVDRPRVPLLWRVVDRMTPGAVSGRILRPVLRHPKVSVVAALALMIGLAVPAAGMKMQAESLDSLPRDIPQVRTMHELNRSFPGQGSGVQVVLRGADRAAEATALRHVARAAEATGDWATGPEGIEFGRAGTGVLTLAATRAAGSDASDEALRQLRHDVIPREMKGLPRAQWAVGGGLAEDYDFAQQLSGGLPKVLLVVFGVMLLMMGFAFRSPVVSVLSILLNLVSVGATLGVVTLVFQHPWAEGILDFRSTGGLISWIPIFLFVVLMGLSMDYHVFVLSRVREHVRAGLPPKAAVGRALEETAGVVTSAAVVMVSVFSLFATLSLVAMKEIGVGLSVAILLDATVVRLVLLPAALVLLGDAAWWPGRRRVVEPLPPVEPEAVVLASSTRLPGAGGGAAK